MCRTAVSVCVYAFCTEFNRCWSWQQDHEVKTGPHSQDAVIVLHSDCFAYSFIKDRNCFLLIHSDYIKYFFKSKSCFHYHNRFTALFSGPPGWAGARREPLDFMVQGKINRGRHTDHPAGRHSIQNNQCPPPSSPMIFTGRMPFLPPSQQRQSTEGKLLSLVAVIAYVRNVAPKTTQVNVTANYFENSGVSTQKLQICFI